MSRDSERKLKVPTLGVTMKLHKSSNTISHPVFDSARVRLANQRPQRGQPARKQKEHVEGEEHHVISKNTLTLTSARRRKPSITYQHKYNRSVEANIDISGVATRLACRFPVSRSLTMPECSINITLKRACACARAPSELFCQIDDLSN